MNQMRVEDRIGKIRFCRRDNLGSGRFGSVFQGKYDDKYDVAVKRVVHTDFLVEIDVLKKAQNHPNILRYYGNDSDVEFVFIATELYTGSLKDIVKETYSGPKVGDLREVLRQITSGLEHLHSRKITHRDLRPSIILISCPYNGNVGPKMKLANFGILRRFPSDLSKMSLWKLAGSKGWMPSETYTEECFTYAMDVFALGCIFGYTLNKGRHPFGLDKDERIIRIKYGQPMEMRARDLLDVNGAIAVFQLIRLMVSSEANRRPSVSEVLRHSFFIRLTKNYKFQPYVSTPAIPRNQPSIVLQPRKTAREEIAGQEELTISLVYPKSKKPKLTDVTVQKKQTFSNLLTHSVDTPITLPDSTTTLLVDMATNESAADESPFVFRPSQSLTIVKAPPRSRPSIIVQPGGSHGNKIHSPSIAAEGGASTSVAPTSFVLQPSLPIAGGSSNPIVYDDSPPLGTPIIISSESVQPQLNGKDPGEDEPMTVEENKEKELPLATENEDVEQTNETDEIPAITEPQEDKNKQVAEEEECEEIPAIARYIQELMEEDEPQPEKEMRPLTTIPDEPPPLEPLFSIKQVHIEEREESPTICDSSPSPVEKEYEVPVVEKEPEVHDDDDKSDEIVPLAEKLMSPIRIASTNKLILSQTDKEKITQAEPVVEKKSVCVKSPSPVNEQEETNDDYQVVEEVDIHEESILLSRAETEPQTAPEIKEPEDIEMEQLQLSDDVNMMEEPQEKNKEVIPMNEEVVKKPEKQPMTEIHEEPVVVSSETQPQSVAVTEEPSKDPEVPVETKQSNKDVQTVAEPAVVIRTEQTLIVKEVVKEQIIKKLIEDWPVVDEPAIVIHNNSALTKSQTEPMNEEKEPERPLNQSQEKEEAEILSVVTPPLENEVLFIEDVAMTVEIANHEESLNNSASSQGEQEASQSAEDSHQSPETSANVSQDSSSSNSADNSGLDVSTKKRGRPRGPKAQKQGQELLFSLCQTKKWTQTLKSQFRNLVEDESILINGVNEEGLSPLLLLCWNQHSEILFELVKIILERPDVDINITDNGEWNALGMACRHCQSRHLIHLVRLLLERGIEVNSKNSDGDNALIVLCANYKHVGLPEMARLLIEHHIDINATNSLGWNALLSVCQNFKGETLFDAVKLFCEAGIDVSKVDLNGNTALMLACAVYKRENLLDIVRLLVQEHNINVKTKNCKGLDAFSILLHNYHGSNILEIMKILIEAGADVNNLADDGWNSLLALFSQQYLHQDFFAMTQLLVEHKVDVNVKDNQGCNPLIFLCSNYKGDKLIDILKLLVKRGIDVNASSVQGWNALFFLCRNKKLNDSFIPAARLLVNAGIDNWNLLHFICNTPTRKDFTQTIRYLVQETDIELAVVDKWGKKPIHYLQRLAAEKTANKYLNLEEAIALLKR